MPDQLHLVERLVERHRCGLVGLLADHERTVALDLDRAHHPGRHLVGLTRDEVALPVELGDAGHDVPDLGRRQPAVATAGVPLVVLLAQSRLELVAGEVERRVQIGRRSLRPDHRAAGVEGDLHAVGPVGLPRVGLLGHLDVEADHLAVELLDLLQLQLLGHVLAEPLGHLGLAALDDDVHAELRSRIARTGSSTAGHLPCTRLRRFTGARTRRLSPPPPRRARSPPHRQEVNSP